MPMTNPESPIIARHGALNVGVFVGCALLSASQVAIGTEPIPGCEIGAQLELRVMSITLEGNELPIPENDPGYSLYDPGEVGYDFEARVCEPDTGDYARCFVLKEEAK